MGGGAEQTSKGKTWTEAEQAARMPLIIYGVGRGRGVSCLHRRSVASELLEPGLLPTASPAPTAAPVGEPELGAREAAWSQERKALVNMVIYRVPGRDA